MATSKSTPAVYASGQDPEAIEANQAYQDALRKLTESLDQRKSRFFDPRYLAAAQGFLAPGAPDFFESLGRVAGNVGKAQDEMIKEDQTIAQQRLELAGRGVELQRQKSKDAMVRRILAGEDISSPAGAAKPPSAGALPSGALPSAGGAAMQPQGALAQAQGVDRPDFGIQVAPAMPGVSRQQYLAAAISEGKSVADALKDWDAIQRGRRAVKEGMIFDSDTGVMYPGSFDMVETQIFGYPGKTFQIPKADAFRLSQFVRNNDEEGYRKLAQRLVEGFGGASAPTAATQAAPSAAPSAGAMAAPAPSEPRQAGVQIPAVTGKPPEPTAKPPGMMSKEDLASASKRREALEGEDTRAEVDARKDFNQRLRDAGDTITTANMLRRFADEPNASKMTGILSNQSVASAIATIVKEGVGSRDFRLALPAIETVMRNAGLNPEDQAKFRVYLMNIAQMQLQMSKYMKGSVSNFEQELMSRAVASTDDTPPAVRIKADLLTRRAQFDRQANRAFKASKMTAEEFLQSEEYEEMKRKYDDQLGDIAIGLSRYESSSRGAAAPSAASPAGGAARPAAAGAGQPSPGFIRDPQTGMIRRKRPGE